MRPLGDRTEHYWLVQRMAKATNTDLGKAYQSGTLDQEHWARMVERCRHCAWADGCKRWLNKEIPTDSAPVTCLNRVRLDQLRRGKGSTWQQ